MHNYTNPLLDAARVINEKHQLEAQLTGAAFNIFSITKMETNEVNTHSAMLAELLNPQGLHHQGDIFLRIFLEGVLGLTEINSTDYAKATVTAEHHIGMLGRIDLMIRLPNLLIVIENKINAVDQKDQLSRYDVWMKKQNVSEAYLYYLSKYGSEASENSHSGEVEYSRLSYQSDITWWLEQCLKEVLTVPMVSGAILQYLSLVRKITGNLGNKKKMELLKLLQSNDAYFEAAMDISNLLQTPQALSELQIRFWQQLQRKLEERLAVTGNKAQVTLDADLEKSVLACMRRKRTNKKPGPQLFGLSIELDGYAPLTVRVEKTTENVHLGLVLQGVDTDVTLEHVDAYDREHSAVIANVLQAFSWMWRYQKNAFKGHVCHRRMQNEELKFHNQFWETYQRHMLYKEDAVDACVDEVMELINVVTAGAKQTVV